MDQTSTFAAFLFIVGVFTFVFADQLAAPPWIRRDIKATPIVVAFRNATRALGLLFFALGVILLAAAIVSR